MKKLILLLSLVLSACVTRIEPENDELPAAQVGQPYHQRIQLHGSIPRSIWVGIRPSDHGLHYRFLYSNPNKKVTSNRGDIIEISGIPNDQNEKFITVYVSGYGYQGRQDSKERFGKEYYIKLIPDKNHPPKPAKTTSPPPDIRPPGCNIIYDEIKQDLRCLERADWENGLINNN
ncbi:hypothetical protein PT286_03120 [Neisseriaceae bacterium ESL0693]|nr:hypothetical protein [Neisseriaceae bacterium ESL0693]